MKRLICSICLIWTVFSRILAQEPATPDAPAETMTVYAAEDFRHRSDQPGPKLVYGRAFFLRFEPHTAGDILARIPGIAGTADAGEFDRAQMRGIAPAYTQVLINGEPLPGSADDRTLALDRIPAHLVSRVEVSRAPDASMDASGIAGTINIIMAEPGGQGLDLLLALNHYEGDSADRGQGSLTWHRQTEWGSWTLAGSVQDRHNPKKQVTDLQVFEDEDEDDEGEEEDEDGEEGEKRRVPRSQLKEENNMFDSLEKALTSNFRTSLPGGELVTANLVFLSTDRQERERSVFSEAGDIVETAFDEGDLQQESWRINLSLIKAMAHHTLSLDISHDDLSVNSAADIGIDEDGERLVEERETDDTEEQESRFSGKLSFEGKPNHRFEIGTSFTRRDRDSRVRLFERAEEGGFDELESGGVFTIDERRLAAYASDTWRFGVAHELQTGVRYERTELHLPGANRDETDNQLFPSLHYLIKQGDNRYRLSLARTTRRPDFKDLMPFPRRNQPYDGQVTFGNPNLKAEMAAGLDLGFEHRFAEHEGLFGINFFYRDIADLVETVRLEEDLFGVNNVGDGEVWGVELDLGMPLDGISLPGVSFYTNISWQDSELVDPGTGLERAFNLQPDLVINATWLHTFPSIGFSYGLNVLHQGEAHEVLLTEISTIDVGDTLDAYLDKRLGKQWSLRLSAHNLTDSKRTVRLEEFNGLWFESDPISTGFERETAGRRFQLTLRGKL